jgi:hypothetical protein
VGVDLYVGFVWLLRAITRQNPQPYEAGWATEANSKQTADSKTVL